MLRHYFFILLGFVSGLLRLGHKKKNPNQFAIVISLFNKKNFYGHIRARMKFVSNVYIYIVRLIIFKYCKGRNIKMSQIRTQARNIRQNIFQTFNKILKKI